MGYITRPIAVDLPLRVARLSMDRSSVEDTQEDSLLWTQIAHLGDPVTFVQQAESSCKEEEELILEPDIDPDLLDFVYGEELPEADDDESEELFGVKTRKRTTYPKVSPWGAVEFHEVLERQDMYKPLSKSKNRPRVPVKRTVKQSSPKT
jgi:hypothetical protein